MSTTLERPLSHRVARVTPSIVDLASAKPFTLEQELDPFGAWASDPIWVPPKDSRVAFAETMLNETRPFASREARWAAVLKNHRTDFTQVRQFDLFAPSIRLPKGRFYVTVTEQPDFEKITDPIPACVQTRLDEFLSGPGQKPGTKVYYLKPLCVELGDELILTTHEDLTAAIAKVQTEVFAEYRRRAITRRPLQAMTAAANMALAIPRKVVQFVVKRRQRAIDAYQARLEFNRRLLALKVAQTHRQCRTSGCTFDETLQLTSPLKRADVIEQYCLEQEISQARRDQLLQIAAGTIPWFISLSLAITKVATALAFSTPPLVVCDPAFVAELPGSPGVLHKIGHFDEIAGVTHIEI
jgi:hypothetical protein